MWGRPGLKKCVMWAKSAWLIKPCPFWLLVMSEMTQHLVKGSAVKTVFPLEEQAEGVSSALWINKLVTHGGRLSFKGWTPG